jgi:hypothetical protein
MPFKKDLLAFEERCVARQGRVVRFANHWPRFLPAFSKVLSHRARMFAAANDTIGVVVELDKSRAPDDADGQIRGQADADRRAQALRPPDRRSQRSL